MRGMWGGDDPVKDRGLRRLWVEVQAGTRWGSPPYPRMDSPSTLQEKGEGTYRDIEIDLLRYFHSLVDCVRDAA